MKERLKKTKSWVLPLLAVVVFTFVVGCPLKILFGIPCPGCGMSRAHLAAAKFDFSLAFYYHPLFWVVIPLVLWLALKKYHFKKWEIAVLVAIVLLFVSVYVIRVFVIHTEFLQPDFKHSTVYWFYHFLKSIIL